MATAYLAEQVSLGRPVVLKVLERARAAGSDAIERFLNEGRIVAALRHPHIITIYDVGEAGDCVFIAMEYVEGGDLKSRIARGVVPPAEALEILSKIASGLDLAHKSGIVHRDVKPGNILFRDASTPLLSDFGIAKQLKTDADLTNTGVFLGSPNYMAPEQADAGPIDGRADLYALGCIFYEMVTGEKPYPAESVVDVIVKHKKAPLPELPEPLAAYRELVSLMLAKHRNDRFRDAESLLHYVEHLKRGMARVDRALEVTGDGTVVGPRATRVALPARRPRRRARRVVLATALAASAVFFGALTLLEQRFEAPEAPVAAVTPAPPESAAAVGMRPAAGDAGAPTTEEVKTALVWLARHSLDEYRLTAPARDNAYYYYSRLAEVAPDSPEPAEGMREIAERFAFLAERALASGRIAEARGFVSVGLQVDPNNRALAELGQLADASESGWFSRFAAMIRGAGE